MVRHGPENVPTVAKPRSASKLIRSASWCRHLNRAAAHIAKRHEATDPVVDGAHLKDLVVFFAREVVRLWREYEQRPGVATNVRVTLEVGRALAFEEANSVTTWFDYPQLDWLADDPAAAWIASGVKWWPTEPV